MKKKITLREIASIAKVSPATASIVLNDKKNQGISDTTWDNVKKIAKKLNVTEHRLMQISLNDIGGSAVTDKNINIPK